MHKLLVTIKNKMYYYFAEKNSLIRREYGPYIETHQEEHIKQPWKHWWLLIQLNWHYRILKKTTPLTKEQSIKLESKKARLPYLDGSESEAFQRRIAIWQAKDLKKYDIISFDIFDTLILRPFSRPVDLFMVVGNKLGIMNYMNIRQQAEKDARIESRVISGTNEVTIYDIYKMVARRTGIDIEKGVKIEFETEMEFCFANPYMLRIFKMLKEQGKRIIIVSDMYYPHDMMKQLLASCGYTDYEKLYVSCDYLCSKRSGGLYKNVVQDFLGCSIIHVGDNFESDINCAKKEGIDTLFYKNCHEIGNPYRADGMSALVGSFYAGIVNTHLHNGIKTYSPYYEYGFIYGGLYILGYCNWIHEKAKQEGIDKILFLSRDGYIYQKIFNMFFNDIPNEYVYWSRIANLKATIESSRSEFLKRIVTNKAYLPIPITIANVFGAISLEYLTEKLPQFGLNGEDLLVPELIPKVENFFIENWSSIVESYQKAIESIRQYLNRIIYDCKKIAVVDVGWIGTGPLGIKYLVEEKWKMNCEVKCYVAASGHTTPSYNTNEIMNNTIEEYIFSHMYNRNLFDVHCRSNKGMNNSFFELFTQANHPSFAGLTRDGKFEFDVAEISNYQMNLEIQQGIIDFCKLYVKYLKENKYLLNIAGYDAYLPFRMIIRNLKLLSNIFGKYSYSFEIGNNSKTQIQETIGDALRQRNLI